MNRKAKDNALWIGIVAVLMLYFGWGVGLVGISDNAFYNTTVDIFYWMLKIGGICLLAAAILCFAGLRIGLLLDAVVSAVCGLIMVSCSAYWLIDEGVNLQYVLYVLFGVMFLNAARRSWSSYTATGPGQPDEPSGGQGWLGVKPLEPPKAPAPPEPPHPASIHPQSLPKDGEPPPPDGYLAALADEEDEPPTASFK
jgi:hypothetical protein